VLRSKQFLAFAAVCALSGCVSPVQSLAISNQKSEQGAAATCKAWEQRAWNAAHPDPQMVKSHDELLAQAAAYRSEAEAQHSTAAERQAAIDNEVQAEANAAAIYDAQGDLKIAADCWRNLGDLQEIHSAMWQELEQSADAPAPTLPPVSDPGVAVVAPPPPSPLPDLGSNDVPSNPPIPPGPGAYVGHVPGGPYVYVIPPGVGTGVQ
jgi:uncharacterized protein YceK